MVIFLSPADYLWKPCEPDQAQHFVGPDLYPNLNSNDGIHEICFRKI